MIAADLYAIAAVVLFGAALAAVVLRKDPLQRLIALNVMGSAVFLFLITLAQRSGGTDPDPVPHAMVLTGIVVAVSITAFAVGLLRRVISDEQRAGEESQP